MSDEVWRIAQRLVIANKFGAVEELMAPVVRERALSGDEAHYYGRALFGHGQVDRAIPLLIQAEASCQEPFWASLFLSRALFLRGRSNEALHALGRAVSQAGSNRHAVAIVRKELAEVQQRSHEIAGRAAEQASNALFAALQPEASDATEAAPLPIREMIKHEIPVTLTLLDVLRPGDIAFDVGTNIGELAMIMSRLVGPRGTVLAFEANSRTAETAMRGLRLQNCGNVTLLNRAVAAQSNIGMELFLGSGPDDSLVPKPGRSGKTMTVQSISLDDAIDFYRLRPRLIKIDVEDYELEVLRGANRYIHEHKPILILAQRDNDGCCLDWLNAAGYRIRCEGSYRAIRGTADYTRSGEAYVRNVFAYHPDGEAHIGTSIEAIERIEFEPIMDLSADDFGAEGPWLRSRQVRLEPGRYTLQQRFQAENTLSLEVGLADVHDGFVGSYASVAWWIRGLPDLPIHVDEAAVYRVAIRRQDGGAIAGAVTPEAFSLLRVQGIPAFRPGMAFTM